VHILVSIDHQIMHISTSNLAKLDYSHNYAWRIMVLIIAMV